MLKLENLSKSKFFKHGLPFIIIVVGGSFSLRYFTSLRYEFSRKEKVTPEQKKEIEKLFKNPSEFNLETEYEKLKQVDLDKWENKRIPRPWED